jgi:hypothetical protein
MVVASTTALVASPAPILMVLLLLFLPRLLLLVLQVLARWAAVVHADQV